MNMVIKVRSLFLKGGEIYIATQPTNITTVLGSCVSVCIWDRKQKIGGMNHFLLPGSKEDEHNNYTKGVNANQALIKSMLINHKCNLEDLEAKVFGGSQFIHHYEVGKMNIEMAYQKLREVGIPIVQSNTGGIQGRKIVFNSETGKVNSLTISK